MAPLGAQTTMSSPNSMTSILLNPLNTLQSLAQTLFLSLSGSSTQSKLPQPPPISAFLECDAALASALQLARVHQIKQMRIEELKSEVLGLEARLREVWGALEAGKRELVDIVEEGEDRIKAIENAKKGVSSGLRIFEY